MIQIRDQQLHVGSHVYPLRNVAGLQTYAMPRSRRAVWAVLLAVIFGVFFVGLAAELFAARSIVGGIVTAALGVALAVVALRWKAAPPIYGLRITMTSGDYHEIAYPRAADTFALRDALAREIAKAGGASVNIDARAIHLHGVATTPPKFP